MFIAYYIPFLYTKDTEMNDIVIALRGSIFEKIKAYDL